MVSIAFPVSSLVPQIHGHVWHKFQGHSTEDCCLGDYQRLSTQAWTEFNKGRFKSALRTWHKLSKQLQTVMPVWERSRQIFVMDWWFGLDLALAVDQQCVHNTSSFLLGKFRLSNKDLINFKDEKLSPAFFFSSNQSIGFFESGEFDVLQADDLLYCQIPITHERDARLSVALSEVAPEDGRENRRKDMKESAKDAEKSQCSGKASDLGSQDDSEEEAERGDERKERKESKGEGEEEEEDDEEADEEDRPSEKAQQEQQEKDLESPVVGNAVQSLGSWLVSWIPARGADYLAVPSGAPTRHKTKKADKKTRKEPHLCDSCVTSAAAQLYMNELSLMLVAEGYLWYHSAQKYTAAQARYKVSCLRRAFLAFRIFCVRYVQNDCKPKAFQKVYKCVMMTLENATHIYMTLLPQMFYAARITPDFRLYCAIPSSASKSPRMQFEREVKPFKLDLPGAQTRIKRDVLFTEQPTEENPDFFG